MPQFFTNPSLPPSMYEGPLGDIVPAYADLLDQQGYTHQSARLQLRFLADLSHWLDRQRFSIADITKALLHRYLRSRHHRLRPRRDDASILKRLLHLLHTKGLLQDRVSPSINSPRQCVENDFDRYLSQERGLSMAARVNYRPFIQRFLSEQFGAQPIQFAHLRAKDVIRFVQNHAHKLSPKRAGLMVSALRSFFRYLRHRGDLTTDLAACVPGIATWQFSSLPKFLQPHQVQQVLNQYDRQTAKGRRDYAILLLLARLGLRACEIVALTLDDIHWQVGEITIRGKGGRVARLPLPADVGKALATYLQKDRPTCSTRRLFIRLKAPRRGFANSIAISTLVARALKQAGIDSPHTGAHLFRHTLATQMLRQGASLAEIAHLLRHQSFNTTTLYAKVDLATLQTLAQPWPGGVR
ncbi:MAG: site-specific integrase [Acidobacteria bacterium]|nr:site-specific integrase [Acidobacteriota bacterium]